MDYIANVENSEIDVSGIRTVLVQGDSSYPVIRFVLDPSLTGLSWRVRGTYTATNIAVLSPEILATESATEITLDWSVGSDFTTYDGDMQLSLVGANDAGTTVVKALADITIQKDWSIGTTGTITLNLFEQLMAQIAQHNNTTGIQGGSPTERYHLTAAEHTVVGNTSGVNTGDQNAAEVSNTPAGNISATDVQAAINELDSEKEAASNKVTSISSASTDVQYPSAKCTYGAISTHNSDASAHSTQIAAAISTHNADAGAHAGIVGTLTNLTTTDKTNLVAAINEIDAQASALASGSPAGTYTNLAALIAANPDHSKIYITLDDGKWCYYSTGSGAFVAGGVYQAAGGALQTSIAPTYSAASTYALGAICTYLGARYKCTTAITVAEAWTAGHWTAEDVQTVLDDHTTQLEDITTSIKKTAYGTFIELNDSIAATIDKLIIYGAMTQTGTPTPSSKIAPAFLVDPSITAWDGVNDPTKDVLAITQTLRAIGNYKDTLEINADGSGKLTRYIKTGAVHLNSINSHSSGDYGFSDEVCPLTDNATVLAISDSFVGIAYNNRALNTSTFRVAAGGNSLYIRFAIGTTYTLAQAQAIVDAATFYWVLATPEVTNYSAGTFGMVALQSPRSVVVSDPAAELAVEYYMSVGAAINSAVPKTVYYVEKDGSGDFTSLVEAINTVCEQMGATLYVGPGTWDLIAELGSTYIGSVSYSQRGLTLKNRVHVICSPQATITCKYTGADTDTIEWLSAFNSGEYGFTLENARIESDNVRYAVHDERGSDADLYTNRYINCFMKHTNGMYVQCIGGGLGLNGHVVIDGCKFEGDAGVSGTSLVSYHNSGDGYWESVASQDAQSVVEIKGSYFCNDGRVELINFGKSIKVSDVLIHGNSFGAAISHIDSTTYAPYVNIAVTEWGNEVRT